MRTIAINKHKEKISCDCDFKENTITFPLNFFLRFVQGFMQIREIEDEDKVLKAQERKQKSLFASL